MADDTAEPGDDRAFDKLGDLCQKMNLEELRRFCAGALKAATVGQMILREKYGLREFNRFNDDVEAGRIKLGG